MWPWPVPATEMNAAQVQVAATALASETKPAGAGKQPPGKSRPKSQPRIPRAVLEQIAKGKTDGV